MRAYDPFHLRGAPPSALRLDDADKRRSRVFVLVSSAWVPVTHASVTPLRNVFQTDDVASLAVGRACRCHTQVKTAAGMTRS